MTLRVVGVFLCGCTRASWLSLRGKTSNHLCNCVIVGSRCSSCLYIMKFSGCSTNAASSISSSISGMSRMAHFPRCVLPWSWATVLMLTGSSHNIEFAKDLLSYPQRCVHAVYTRFSASMNEVFKTMNAWSPSYLGAQLLCCFAVMETLQKNVTSN